MMILFTPIRAYVLYSNVGLCRWSFWSRQVGGYFLLDFLVTYLLSCFVLCCTCLMFDCVRNVVDSLVCHSVKVSQFQEVSLDLAASISLATYCTYIIHNATLRDKT